MTPKTITQHAFKKTRASSCMHVLDSTETASSRPTWGITVPFELQLRSATPMSH